MEHPNPMQHRPRWVCFVLLWPLLSWLFLFHGSAPFLRRNEWIPGPHFSRERSGSVLAAQICSTPMLTQPCSCAELSRELQEFLKSYTGSRQLTVGPFHLHYPEQIQAWLSAPDQFCLSRFYLTANYMVFHLPLEKSKDFSLCKYRLPLTHWAEHIYD